MIESDENRFLELQILDRDTIPNLAGLLIFTSALDLRVLISRWLALSQTHHSIYPLPSGAFGNFQEWFKSEWWKNFKNGIGIANRGGGWIFDVGVDYFETAIADLRNLCARFFLLLLKNEEVEKLGC